MLALAFIAGWLLVASPLAAQQARTSVNREPVGQGPSENPSSDPGRAEDSSASDERPSDEGQASAAVRASESAPRLSDEAELDQIIELYMAGQYERCTGRLSGFLDAKGPAPFREAGVIERARLYYASCSLLVGRREQARRALRSALEANPLMPAPDSLTFPPPVVSMFLEVREEVELLIAKREQEQLEEMQREAEARERRAQALVRQEKELRRLAQEETVVVESSRVIASLPFGAGQFQSGKNSLGWAFLVSETVLLGTAVTSGVIYTELLGKVAGSGGQATAPMNTSYQVLGLSSYALLSVAALGIIEAHWTFQKERTVRVRKRELPAELRETAPGKRSTTSAEGIEVRPSVEVSPNGAHFSLIGRF